MKKEILNAIKEHESRKASGFVGQTVKGLYRAAVRRGLRSALEGRLAAEENAISIAAMAAIDELDDLHDDALHAEAEAELAKAEAEYLQS